MTTPRAQGFAMPPAWAPHERCWMAWPGGLDLEGERIAAIRRAAAEVARAIADFEPVTMLARPELIAEASLHCGKGCSVLPMDYDRPWMRDVAPTFVRGPDGALAGVHWRFNGYGERVTPYAADARLAEAICERLKIPRFATPIVLEGGAIEVDGEGTCLACAASVLDPERNPGLSRERMAEILGDHLGVTRVIWLEHGLIDDPAGGHVANVARFARPGVVLAPAPGDADDADHDHLEDNLARLQGERDAAGRALEVITIARPEGRLLDDGRRLIASYLGFYLANGAVIMPMFDDTQDTAAYKAIAAAFPEHRVVQIDAIDLIRGGGIHRLTQPQPDRSSA